MNLQDSADPRASIKLILSLCDNGKLPRGAALWASAALKTANNVFYRVKSLKKCGRVAPTESHIAVLVDLGNQARQWLATIEHPEPNPSDVKPDYGRFSAQETPTRLD